MEENGEVLARAPRDEVAVRMNANMAMLVIVAIPECHYNENTLEEIYTFFILKVVASNTPAFD